MSQPTKRYTPGTVDQVDHVKPLLAAPLRPQLHSIPTYDDDGYSTLCKGVFMPSWRVVRGGEVDFVETTDDVASGLSEAVLIGPGDGAIHLEVALARLEPGGIVNGHIHPFEESFYLLEGEVVFTVADQSYQIMPGGFGFAPIATAHTWFAASDAPAVWIRTRSPQPRTLGKTNGTYPVAHRLAKRSGQP